MSAWFVGEDHINAMLTWLDHCHRYGLKMPDGTYQQTLLSGELTEIGKTLIAENIASLRARYPSDWQDMVDIDVNAYQFKRDIHFIALARPLHVTLMKLVACYEYQSCEHDGWRESWAHGFCMLLTNHAIGMLPGYDDAPWGYDGPESLNRAA